VVREHIFNIVLLTDPIIDQITTSHDRASPLSFTRPLKRSKPSVAEEVVHRPLAILDPYILALRKNFYYPLHSEDFHQMPEEEQGSTAAAIGWR